MPFNSNNVARIQKYIRDSQTECVIVPLGINFGWLFGFHEEPSERPTFGIVESEGLPKLIVPEYERIEIKKLTNIPECIGWEETENPYKILRDLISNKQDGIIGIEPKMWFSVYQELLKHFPEKKFTSAEDFFCNLREVKSEEEQKLLMKASQKSADAIIETLDELEDGITEIEVHYILEKKLRWGTNEKWFIVVNFGENSAKLPCFSGNRKLEKDNVVLIDAGGTLQNYWGDITIASVFGKATRLVKKIYDIVKSANEHAKEAVIQNKSPHEVDTAARDYIIKKGYGEYFTHRTGHGIGLELHESPYIIKNNKSQLVPGNVFTIEPGIYLEGKFGIRIEDDVFKTSTGIETSQIPREEYREI
jgi:Xaa-Pro dipeptidase